MINKIKEHATKEELAIIEQHSSKEELAIIHLNMWARTLAVNNVAVIEDNKVIEKFVELIQTDLKQIAKPAAVKHKTKVVAKEEIVGEQIPKPKKEPKPPKMEKAKKFKDKNQIGFGFDFEVQEVEQKPIWEQ